MNFITFLEFNGMLFALLGAIYMSRNQTTYKNTMLYAFSFFTFSNMSMLIVAYEHNMLPLVIQQILFFTGAIIGVKLQMKNVLSLEKYLKYNKIFNIILFVYISLLILFVSSNSIDFSFVMDNIEIFAAILAIIGNFLLPRELYLARIAFQLFIIADILYVFIAYEHNMYFFLVQSLFTVYTAYKGLKNTNISMREHSSLNVAT